MRYNHTVKGVFLERPNRFIAYVMVEGKKETVHVKNTGRCKELLVPNAQVILEVCDNPNRKTKYDLIGVYKDSMLGQIDFEKKEDCLVNMDSQAPNKVVGEWLCLQKEKEKCPKELRVWENISYIKPEYTYGDSRLDFYFERMHGDETKKVLMEVKGVTLEKNGKCYFPDAPTLRGVKHIHELAKAVEKGYETYLAFVIQMKNITYVIPNDETHKEFGEAIQLAKNAGVNIIYLGCDVMEDELRITRVNKEDINVE